jgi:tetratricopeptide (TPR) repeat protein
MPALERVRRTAQLGEGIMRYRHVKLALLVTSALVAGALLAGRSGATTEKADVRELFDPAYQAAGVCGPAGEHARTLFQPAMQMALATGDKEVKGDSTPPVLYDNLGSHTYPITTGSERAQRFFDQGLRLTYAFNQAEALRAYRQGQREDPECAMCYWGEAYVLGPNINAPMGEASQSPAVAAIQRAGELAPGAGGTEQALIEALAVRYEGSYENRAELDRAYADAMARVYERFPEDEEVAVLFADAVMNTSPWDYWEADATTPKEGFGDVIAAVEKVLAANPDHPGAIHLYIHLTEASAAPERAEPHADRLAGLMPGAGHIVHMPSHTYYRIGRYLDSLELNIAAVEADEAYLATVEPGSIYAHSYYPHNIHFALASAQMAGDGEHMLWAAERLRGKIPDEVAAEIGWIQIIKPAPYYAHAQFSEPGVILAIADPGDQFPFVKAMWHYARGTAQAAKGEIDAARTEAAQIAELNASADFSMLQAWLVPANDVLRLARHVLEGRIAQAEGDHERAAREFQVAVDIQDSLPYLEPPYWYYPVRQSLGAALLEAGQAEAAEQAFREALIEAPNNGWALFGLMRAQEALGDEAGAAETAKLFEAAWAGDPAGPDPARL